MFCHCAWDYSADALTFGLSGSKDLLLLASNPKTRKLDTSLPLRCNCHARRIRSSGRVYVFDDPWVAQRHGKCGLTYGNALRQAAELEAEARMYLEEMDRQKASPQALLEM